MKKYIISSSYTSYFSKNNLRFGTLYYDHTDLDSYTTTPSGYDLNSPTIYYVYDTVLHMNGAKLQDAEDWDAANVSSNHISNMLQDLSVDLASLYELSGLVYYDRVRVIIDVYGLGNRSFQIIWELYGEVDPDSKETWEETKGKSDVAYIYDIDHILTNKDNMLSYGDKSVILDKAKINPNSNFMRRRFCKTIVDYLSEGYSNLN